MKITIQPKQSFFMCCRTDGVVGFYALSTCEHLCNLNDNSWSKDLYFRLTTPFKLAKGLLDKYKDELTTLSN